MSPTRVLVPESGRNVIFLLDNPGDRIAKVIRQTRGFYEIDLLRDAQSRFNGGAIVDVGAHIGNHTLFFGKIMGARVHSFEPNPPSFSELTRNLRLNGLRGNVTAYPWAVGDSDTTAEVFMPDGATNTGMAQVEYGKGEIPAKRLDDVVGNEKVGLIKVDVEGNELSVLKGAERILERDHPLLYVEVGNDEERSQEVHRFLAKFGYKPFGTYAHTPTVGFFAPHPATLSATIMAHPARVEFVDELTKQFNISVTWDQINDRWDTGRRSLLAYDPEATHHLVLQDDAVAPDNLLETVQNALGYVSLGSPVALYLGAVARFRRVWQRSVRPNTSWVTMPGLNWGVGIVVPTVDIPAIVKECDEMRAIGNYDLRLSRFYEHRNIYTWYPWPSLVDHRDSPSLVPGRRGQRHAYRYIGDATFDPTGGVVTANVRR